MRSSSISAWLAGALVCASLLPAASRAQDSGTVLRLSETAEVERTPQEVSATLRAEARGADSRTVQAQVNSRMTAALAAARAVQGVQASTGGYWTTRQEKERNWLASQSLTLRGTEPGPLLELAGALQGQGLVMDGMGWSLSRTQRLEARQEAGRLAVEALRARAEAVAQQLGLQVAELRELRLDAPDTGTPRFRAAPMMAARAEAAPPPVSAPQPEMVSATAEASFLLRR
jgi:predicted secreted protein